MLISLKLLRNVSGQDSVVGILSLDDGGGDGDENDNHPEHFLCLRC